MAAVSEVEWLLQGIFSVQRDGNSIQLLNLSFLSRRRSAETQCWVRTYTSVCPHSWCACAVDLVMYVAAPYCARQQTRSCVRFQQERLNSKKSDYKVYARKVV